MHKINNKSIVSNIWRAKRQSLSQMSEKTPNNLKKGAMKRLAPFHPKEVGEGERKTVEGWVSSLSGDSIRDRIPRLEGHGRTRALHKLRSKTQHRVNPETGHREYLLHRGMGGLEHEGLVKDKAHGKFDSHSSWTPHFDVARAFADDYYEADGMEDKSHIVSAWIPEKHIHHIPTQIGEKRVEPSSGREVFYPTYYSAEHEVITEPHEPKIHAVHEYGYTSEKDEEMTGKPKDIISSRFFGKSEEIMKKSEKKRGTFLHGIGASEHLDSSGERIKLEGVDISSLTRDGVFNYEHKSESSSQVVGKILEAKKIFKRSDCENDHHLYFWDKIKVPFLYVAGELFDAVGHSGAQDVAAHLRYDEQGHENKESQNLVNFSIEGSRLDKRGSDITKCIARKITITITPCNKAAGAEIKKDINTEKSGDLGFIQTLMMEKNESSCQIMKGEIPFLLSNIKSEKSLKKTPPFIGVHNIQAAQNVGPYKHGELQRVFKTPEGLVHHYEQDGDNYYAIHENNNKDNPVISAIHVAPFYDPEYNEDHEGLPYVQHAATVKEHQGKGLGSALYRTAIKNHKTLLSSTAMSPLSQKTWEKVSKHPNINVEFSEDENKPHAAFWSSAKKKLKKSEKQIKTPAKKQRKELKEYKKKAIQKAEKVPGSKPAFVKPGEKVTPKDVKEVGAGQFTIPSKKLIGKYDSNFRKAIAAACGLSGPSTKVQGEAIQKGDLVDIKTKKVISEKPDRREGDRRSTQTRGSYGGRRSYPEGDRPEGKKDRRGSKPTRRNSSRERRADDTKLGEDRWNRVLSQNRKRLDKNIATVLSNDAVNLGMDDPKEKYLKEKLGKSEIRNTLVKLSNDAYDRLDKKEELLNFVAIQLPNLSTKEQLAIAKTVAYVREKKQELALKRILGNE